MLDEKDYVGEYKDAMPHGVGTMTYMSGAKYVGEWEDGKWHGKGLLTCPYWGKHEGEWKHGVLHGQGTAVFPDGTIYVGQFDNNVPHGRGVFSYSDGKKYDGDIKENMFHGQGAMNYSDGTVYEGEWKDGRMDGQGILRNAEGDIVKSGEWEKGVFKEKAWRKNAFFIIFVISFIVLILAELWILAAVVCIIVFVFTFKKKKTLDFPGIKYKGELKRGKRRGFGVAYMPDGSKYEGLWKYDKPHGQGTHIYVDGRKYEGAWKDGKRHGKGTEFYLGGAKRYEGEFKDNEADGQGVYFLPNGTKVYEGEFKDGRYCGQGSLFFMDKSKYVGEIKNNRPDGQGVEFDSDGNTVRFGIWEKGCFIENESKSRAAYSSKKLIEILEETYYELRRNNPDRDEHWYLSNTWLKRYGNTEDAIQKGPELMKFISYKETHQFAVLHPPDSIRGVALFCVYKELGDEQAEYYVEEFNTLMAKIINYKESSSFLEKYKEINPRTWRENQEKTTSPYSIYYLIKSFSA